eukprot:4170090-Amphidinium_carterae.1
MATAFHPSNIGQSTSVPRQNNKTTTQRNHTLVIFITILRQNAQPYNLEKCNPSTTPGSKQKPIKAAPFNKNNIHNIGHQSLQWYSCYDLRADIAVENSAVHYNARMRNIYAISNSS